ncbi:MAG TPA: PDZ domain-containing protein, partial [Candidatus Sabulitectum sp.]|nr:PDZ domain-containing protein [Candidatus Sabulitectum sp.]
MTASGSSISSVKRPSPASRAGLRKGDIILSCAGLPVRDWVDLLSAVSGSSAELVVKRGLSLRRVTLRRGPGEELGIELSSSGPAPCRNRCVFCFIDQQPPGLRKTLMVKDDDVRYSFLQGTYIT